MEEVKYANVIPDIKFIINPYCDWEIAVKELLLFIKKLQLEITYAKLYPICMEYNTYLKKIFYNLNAISFKNENWYYVPIIYCKMKIFDQSFDAKLIITKFNSQGVKVLGKYETMANVNVDREINYFTGEEAGIIFFSHPFIITDYEIKEFTYGQELNGVDKQSIENDYSRYGIYLELKDMDENSFKFANNVTKKDLIDMLQGDIFSEGKNTIPLIIEGLNTHNPKSKFSQKLGLFLWKLRDYHCEDSQTIKERNF